MESSASVVADSLEEQEHVCTSRRSDSWWWRASSKHGDDRECSGGTIEDGKCVTSHQIKAVEDNLDSALGLSINLPSTGSVLFVVTVSYQSNVILDATTNRS